MTADLAVIAAYRIAMSGRPGRAAPAIDARMCKRMLLPAFTDDSEENHKILAAMASETDMRMFVQQGCFTVHSSAEALNSKRESSTFLRAIIKERICSKNGAGNQSLWVQARGYFSLTWAIWLLS